MTTLQPLPELTPEQHKAQLRSAISTFEAELRYPASGAYTSYCQEQVAKLKRELAELEATEAGGQEA